MRNKLIFTSLILCLFASSLGADMGPIPQPSEPQWMYVLEDIDGDGVKEKISFLTRDLHMFGSLFIGNDIPGSYAGDFVGLRSPRYIIKSGGETLLSYALNESYGGSLVSSNEGILETRWSTDTVQLTRRTDLNLERCLMSFTIKNISQQILTEVEFSEWHYFDDIQYEVSEGMVVGQLVGENRYWTWMYPLMGMVYVPTPDVLQIYGGLFTPSEARFNLGGIAPGEEKTIRLSIIWSTSSNPYVAREQIAQKLVQQKRELGRWAAGEELILKDTIPNDEIEIILSSLTEQPYSITTQADKTILEWRYDSINIGEKKSISFDLNLSNLIPGEDRMVNEKLDLSYTNILGETTNYSLRPQYVHVYFSSFDTQINTDKTEYNPDEYVLINGAIQNMGEITKTIDAKIIIEDTQANKVDEVATFTLSNFTPGQSHNFNYAWNTTTTFASGYKAHIYLYEGTEQIGDSFANFTILAPQLNLGVEAEVVTDKLSYTAHEEVTIASKVKNINTNFTYDNLTVNLIITNPGGDEVLNTDKIIFQLLPQTQRKLTIYWNTGSNPPGKYTLTQKVFYNNQPIDEDTTTFQIVPSPQVEKGLSGSITVMPQQIFINDEVSFSYKVTNIGNIDLSDLALKVMIVDIQAKQAVNTYTEEGIVLLMGESYVKEFTDVINLPPKYYMVVLVGETEGQTIPIDSTYLLVKFPAEVVIKPESFNQNTGVFTAFIKFPEGYDVSTVTDAQCDGAPAHEINYDQDKDKMILKFRRDEVTDLPLDIYFTVTGHFDNGLIFEGSDTIKKIIE